MNKHIEETESKHGEWIKELREKEDKLNYENMGQYSIMEYRHNTKRSLENRRRYYHGGYYPEWLEQKHDWLDNAIKQQEEDIMKHNFKTLSCETLDGDNLSSEIHLSEMFCGRAVNKD